MEEGRAYTLKEIQAMLSVLGEPARTAVLVAALTGLRMSEIRR
jgi:integrase